jgi:putative transposase
MNQRIITKQLTKAKRTSQICKVFEVKVDKSHLSTFALKNLNSLFIQAKYYYNYCISQSKLDNASTTIKKVDVKVIDHFEERELFALTGQMKQSIKTRIFSNILTLSSLKKKGYKVGKIDFKSHVDSIPLKQYNKTFFVNFDNSTIRIQGLKKKLKVNGLNQIPKNSEIANALLIKKNNDFYLNITTYQDKVQNCLLEDNSVGIDFGCQTQLTLSNGLKIEFQIPISKKLKRLDRKIMKNGRNKLKSKNKTKDQIKRQKEYTRLTNQKKDIKHKIVRAITQNYKRVCFQDENIRAWHSGNHGKKIQNTSIGGIIRDLKLKSHTPIEVDKFFPSTQLCPQCGQRNKLDISDRTYICKFCNYVKDRDLKSSICILEEGLKNNKYIRAGSTDSKPLEIDTSACNIFNSLKRIKNVHVSFCQ